LAFDENIYELRRQKLKQIEALGQTAYRSKYDVPHTIGYVRDKYEHASAEQLDAERPQVQLAGRITAIRLMGKAGFAHLQSTARRDRTGSRKLQIYVKRDAVGEKGFELYKLLDIGDIVGVRGYLFHTRTGELTIHVEELTFLAKSFLPLPEKWHGLTDVETRYRQRYVDLIMNPQVRGVFIKRSKLIRSIRQFLDEREFVEVETPMMQPIAGGAVARPFVTHHNALDMDLYLRIAPELYLKRLLVGGFDRVYEINRNFRNEGLSARHNPEFTMLEFYQAYTDCQGVMDLTQDLIVQAVKDVTKDKNHPDGLAKTTWGDQLIDWTAWTRMSMMGAVIKYWPASLQPPDRIDFGHWPSLMPKLRRLMDYFNAGNRWPFEWGRQLVALAVEGTLPLDELGIDPTKAPHGRILAELFEALVENHLVQPTIIFDFPSDVSPLSKAKSADPFFAERFEIYAGQMEISNGFSELNDPVDQRRRFEAQLKERERGDDEAHQMDEDYIRALSYGMPPAGGVGVGVDRLCMLLTDSHTIRDVILFPLLRPEKSPNTEGTEDKP